MIWHARHDFFVKLAKKELKIKAAKEQLRAEKKLKLVECVFCTWVKSDGDIPVYFKD